MSVASEIERLRTARNDIRTKLVEMGLAASTNDLDELAAAIVAIANNGKVELKLDTETTSRPIPAGYHNGGGRMYITVDEKDPVTPTNSTQTVSAGEGTVLGEVVVLPIPDAYQDVSDVTATTDDVLANRVFVDSTGAVLTGGMTNNGKAELLVDTKTPSVTIPKGYHDGTGRAYVEVEDEKSVTPTKASQSVAARSWVSFSPRYPSTRARRRCSNRVVLPDPLAPTRTTLRTSSGDVIVIWELIFEAMHIR